MSTPVIASLCLLLFAVAPAAHAQRSSYQVFMDNNRIMMDRINGDMAMRTMCEDWKRKGDKVPAGCAEYASSSVAAPPSPTATRFSPVTGDVSVKSLADSLGSTPEERGQILQLAGAGKELFAQKYKGKGWDNTLAGAMTFFIVATHIVSTDAEPDAAAEERLFASLNATLAGSDIARASNADKTALYNTLLAGAGLPLVFYVDGKQSGNDAQVKQAKTMAAGFARRFLGVEPQALAEML
ncbi:MAG: hypothetical protein DI562_18480 [Stenotrophomonas acidaminiphila]|jgi:hypothetical protein|nr:MAG: hypothetical protein DI562_18480 [Stenotrophomonas acidaminiphila]